MFIAYSARFSATPFLFHFLINADNRNHSLIVEL
jgi:hypothetical protein